MIVITGATGQLGRLVIQSLLERGAAPASLVAAVRQPARQWVRLRPITNPPLRANRREAPRPLRKASPSCPPSP